MDKTLIIQQIIEILDAELQAVTQSSKEAADYATHEESKAESKWDTQALEASYLAAGQANRANELADGIQKLKLLANDITSQSSAILGALVECNLSGFQECYFLSPAAGGVEFTFEGKSITVITPKSPIAKNLMGKSSGSQASLPNGNPIQILNIY